MRYSKSRIITFLIILVISCLIPIATYANSAEPPSFTIIVSNAPKDLSLSLQFPNKGEMEGILLKKEQKAWESYYRFFYHMSPSRSIQLDGCMLIVKSAEKSFQCSLPVITFNRYNNFLTLDMETETLSVGQPKFRVALLVIMRVILTLLIEGCIFFLFGYRKKQSWIAFLAINIITQGGLNAMLTGPGMGSYWIFGFIFGEILVLAIELIAFIYFMKEFKKRRAVIYTVVANVFSLVLGGLLIAYLPI